MGFGNIVVIREQQSRPAAAVVPLAFDEQLGRTASPLIDHKLSFCAVDSPDEAVYLASFLNSTPIQDLLASFSNEIAIAPQTLRRLPIPDFDLAGHTAVIDAGRDAIEAARAGNEVDQGALDAAVTDALGLGEYAPQRAPTSPARESLPGLK